jgi:hypothetical protein
MSCVGTSSNWLGSDTAFCPSARSALATRRYSPDETVGACAHASASASRTALPLSMSVSTGMRRPARRSRAAPRRSDCADHSPGGGRNLVVPAAIEGMLSAHAIAETVE